MKNQIIIQTTDTGVRLYNSAIDALNFHATHLDQLNSWDKMIDELMALQAVHDINYGVDLKNLKALISINSLLSRAIVDLNLIGSELYLSKIRLQQVFYIKHAYLVIYETFENLREQQSFLSKMVNDANENFSNDFKIWVKQKREFFKTYELETTIRSVRDKLAGHIELDFKLWYETVLLLNPSYAADLIIDYMKLLTPLQALTTDMVYFYRNTMETTSKQLNEKNIKMFNQLEALIVEVNERQPTDGKLEIDLSILRNLIQKPQ